MTAPIAMFEVDNAKVNTLADGSPRFTFDGTEKAIPELSKIAQAKIEGKMMVVIVYDKEDIEKELKPFKAVK